MSAWEANLRGGNSFDEVESRSPKLSPSRTHHKIYLRTEFFFFSYELSTRNINYLFLRLKKCMKRGK